jgi:phosphatidate cytidylyltransferase
MADDKREGSDDLFEDLDKFFAPIQDVDWPEADEPAAPASTPAAVEHVAVHVEPAAPPPEPDPDPVVVSTDDDAAWYDTSVLETFDVTDDDPGVGETAPARGQASLLSGDDAGAADDDWPGEDASDAGPDEPDRGREDTSVSPAMAELISAEPTPEDLEAAAEHFADSVRDEAGSRAESGVAMPFDDEPLEGELVSVVPADGGDDLFGDLAGGGEAAPAASEDDILADLEESGAPRTVKVGSEGLGGPSWQEPTSVEVGADIDRRGPNAGERDVPAAFLTGLVLAGIALGSLLIGDALFALLAAAVVLLAQGELYGVLHKHHLQPATAVGLSTGVLIMAAAYYKGEGAMLAMFGLGVVATFLWFLAVPAAHRKNLVANMGLTLLGIAYIPVLAGYVLLTLKLPDGDSLVITVIALTLVFDTAAFLGGSVFGGVQIQRPLAPATSPKKSWEGTILATAATVLCAAIAKSFVTSLGDAGFAAFGLGLVVAVAATLGDLAESLVKRDMGIKDMSSVLPGHGGVLDRIDSVLFVAPAAFLFFRIIFL